MRERVSAVGLSSAASATGLASSCWAIARCHVTRPTVSLAQAVVRPVPLRQARQMIERCEPMCGVATFAYGLFIGNALASVVVFGVHPAANLRRCEQGICLLRGVTLPWAY
jgi:hypothetical protein